jgi:predicted RND superfamily exporter protein
MGTAVIGGIAAASAIAIFIIPALFYVIEKIGGAKDKAANVSLPATPEARAATAGDD